jgi:glucose/arabinose dehydrogenase
MNRDPAARVNPFPTPGFHYPVPPRLPSTPLFARLSRCLQLALILLAFVLAAPAEAAPPAKFAVEDVLTNIEQPMSLRFLPDGRMLVIQKKGLIRIVDTTTTPGTSEIYLNLAASTHPHGIKSDQERGLLDIAIDPDFPTRPYIYLFYTPNSGPDGQRARIARFTHRQNSGGLSSRGDPASEVILWQDTHGYDSCCHFGGGLDFGPDGKLWLTVGDHFQGSYAASLSHAGGGVIRINRDGSIPADNPYIDGAGPNHDALFAYGLRNPFRARWDLPTGRLFIAEVGGNEQTKAWEDLHVIEYDAATGRFIDDDFGTANDDGRFSGINFGWPTVEGLPPYTDFPAAVIDRAGEPIFAYPHRGDTAAINGGIVYRGTLFPTTYQGAYFYADSTRDFIRYLKFNADGSIAPNPNPGPIGIKNPDPISYPFDLNPLGRIVALEVGPDGALYYVSFTDQGGAYGVPNPTVLGAVRRYVYDSNTRAQITTFSAQPETGRSPLPVEFRLVATDPERNPLTYVLHFGDGTSTGSPQPLLDNTLKVVTHTYTSDGIYEAQVEVHDGTTTSVSTVTVRVGTPPSITTLSARNHRSGGSNTSFRYGDTFTFSATATDLEDGTLSGASFTWSVSFVRPGNVHPAYGPETGSTSAVFPIPAQGQGFSGPVFYRASLTVTDSSGLSSNATYDIFPEKSDITFQTVPSGIMVQVDGNTEKAAPYILDTLINFDHTISVPETVCIAGTSYRFSAWSNGPTTPQQTYNVPATNTTLTATYVAEGPCAGPPTEGLVLHLRGDAGVVLQGSSVTVWEDQTTFGNHLVATGGPTYRAGSGSSPSHVHFDGVDDVLARAGFTGLPTGSAARSVFMAARYNAANASNGGWVGFAYGTAANNQAFGLTLTPTGTLGVQGWGRGNDVPASPATVVTGEWVNHSAIFGSGQLTQYVNGNHAGSTTRSYATGTAGIRLGEELNGGKNLDMDVAEILVYNRALTVDERERVQLYLANRYTGGGSGGGTPPTVSISAPAANAQFTTAQMPITLRASAQDTQDGDISDEILWRSSIDGALGIGSSLSVTLSTGTHTLTATAIDSDSQEAADSVSVTVTGSTGGGGPGGGSLVTEGLVLHLESDLNVSTGTGATVAGWLDQSGLGNDLVAVGDPQLATAATPGGKPAIRLDGNDRLERAHATDALGGLPTANANRTLFIVANYLGTSAWGGVSYGSAASNRAFGLGVKHPTGELFLQGYGSGNDLVSTTAGVGQGWLVQSGQLSGGTATLFRNGAQIAQFNHNFNTTLTRLVIGQEIGQLGYITMDVAAVLIYNRALSSTERAAVESYLSGKYLNSSNAPPAVTITAPANGASFATGSTVTFSGTASDPEQGNLSSSLRWSSSVSGSLGTGASVSTSSLPAGTHVITAAVTDAGGLVDSQSITISITANNAPPTVTITAPANGASFATGSTVTFTGTASDPEQGNLSSSLRWSSSVSGSLGTGASVSTSSLPAGTHVITAAVTDAGGLVGSQSITISITAGNAPPTVTITTPADGSSFATGTTVTFSGTASDPEQGNLSSSLRWSSSVSGSLGTGASVSTSSLPAGTHVITAAVTDAGGLSASKTISITITSSTATTLPVTSGLVLHLDAAEGVATSGATVTAWNDRSTRGNSLTATGGPQLITSGTPKGLPAVRLDGVDDYLERIHATAPLAGFPTGNANRTVFVVARYTSTTWWGGMAYGTAAQNRTFGLGVKHPSGELVLQGYGSTHDLVSSTAGKGAGWLVQSGVHDNGTARMFKDGTLIAQRSHSYATTLTRLIIGREIGNAGYIGMDVAAVLVYDRALSAAEHSNVTNYLRQRFLQ